MRSRKLTVDIILTGFSKRTDRSRYHSSFGFGLSENTPDDFRDPLSQPLNLDPFKIEF
jgi:hypothetical protein